MIIDFVEQVCDRVAVCFRLVIYDADAVSDPTGAIFIKYDI
jgi:hypothetical protein